MTTSMTIIEVVFFFSALHEHRTKIEHGAIIRLQLGTLQNTVSKDRYSDDHLAITRMDRQIESAASMVQFNPFKRAFRELDGQCGPQRRVAPRPPRSPRRAASLRGARPSAKHAACRAPSTTARNVRTEPRERRCERREGRRRSLG